MREPSAFMSQEFISEFFPAFSKNLKSQRTVSEYFSSICLYCDYIGKDFSSQKMEDALSYHSYLLGRIESGSFSRTTLMTRICAYRKLEDFLRDVYGEDTCERCWAKIQLPALDSSVKEDRLPSREVLDRLLTLSKQEGIQWHTVMTLVIKCALTATEVSSLKLSSFILEKDELYIYIPKVTTTLNYQEKRYMKLPEDAKDIVTQFLKQERKREDGFVFHNKAGRKLSLKNIDDALLRMQKNEDKKYSLRDIRTRSILEMLASSDNPAAVSEYVGLSKLRMKAFVDASGLIDNKRSVADYNNIIIKPFKD